MSSNMIEALNAVGKLAPQDNELEGLTDKRWYVGGNGLIVYRADGWAICDCKTFHGKISKEQGEANAEAIALLPELLEAAKILIKTNPVFRSMPVGAPNSPMRLEQVDKMIAEDNLRVIITKLGGWS